MIPVTKAYLPNKDKYKQYIDQIYESNWLTNNGKLLQELENRLKEYLGVRHLILVANGSLALQLAYKALELKGEVITTPFSFAATTSTLVWEGLTPIFADIDSDSFNLSPKNIESKITDLTTAVLPVHVFGNPCEVDEIERVAKKNKLSIIYDAAHAFGTEYSDDRGHNQSILNYGDISTVSFHATKIFHTIEGGAVITNNDELAKKIRLLINFGITGPTTIESVGTNAKMNEFEAAMGLCILDEIDIIKSRRKEIWEHYYSELKDCNIIFQKWNDNSENNHSYAPVLFKNENKLLSIQGILEENNIYTRRYFYPSLDSLNYLGNKQNSSVSRDIASRILCLPLYPTMNAEEQGKVINLIKREL